MKASAGDSTVGVALENLESNEDVIQVLISRRNKSLTVEQVEEQITQRVADMEIEDEVNLLMAQAMDNLGVEEKINQVNLKVIELDQKFNGLKVLGDFYEIDAEKIKVKEFKVAGEMDVVGDAKINGSLEVKQGIVEMIAVRALRQEEIQDTNNFQFPISNFQNATSTATTTDEIAPDDYFALPEAGDVLVMDPENDLSAIKSYEKNSNKILGIALKNSENGTAPLVLNGSALVKISLENGEIKKGDLLTTSSLPGYAAKAIDEKAGIVGIALQDYEEASTKVGKNKIEVLLTIKNNIIVNWDDASVSVIDQPNLGAKVEVVDYDFQGKVTINDLVVTGNVSVIGKAEFLADATFKSNLNLEGAIIREYQEALNNNLKIGDAVYISGSNLVTKAYSDITDENGNFKPAIGIVVEIQTDFPPDGPAGSQGQEETSSKEGLKRMVKVAVGGTVNGFKNLVPGAVYYLNNTDSINNINISDSATST